MHCLENIIIGPDNIKIRLDNIIICQDDILVRSDDVYYIIIFVRTIYINLSGRNGISSGR